MPQELSRVALTTVQTCQSVLALRQTWVNLGWEVAAGVPTSLCVDWGPCCSWLFYKMREREERSVALAGSHGLRFCRQARSPPVMMADLYKSKPLVFSIMHGRARTLLVPSRKGPAPGGRQGTMASVSHATSSLLIPRGAPPHRHGGSGDGYLLPTHKPWALHPALLRLLTEILCISSW